MNTQEDHEARIARLEKALDALAGVVRPEKQEVQWKPDNRFQRIMEAVLEEYDITEEMLRSRTRMKRVVVPRMVLMYLARESGMGPVEIGRTLGRDSGTVTHARVAVRDWLETDDEESPKIRSLIHRFPTANAKAEARHE